MNRVIKFRAWDGKTMHNNGFFIKPHGDTSIIPPNYDFMSDDLILMQFTGMYDKDGKEIYEGDMLGHKNNIVEFSGGCFNTNGDRMLFMLIEPEVIGNIFEGVLK